MHASSVDVPIDLRFMHIYYFVLACEYFQLDIVMVSHWLADMFN